MSELGTLVRDATAGDYLDRYKPAWITDGHLAVEALRGMARDSETDLLLVDWRLESSVEAAKMLLGAVGIKLEFPELPIPERVIRTGYKTGKSKMFSDLLLPTTGDIHIVERRVALPAEGQVVGSFFRGFGSQKLEAELRKAAQV